MSDPRRVVCAAIRAADGTVLLGIRHYSQDMHDQIARTIDGAKFYNRREDDQGFVDQHGVYLTRREAMRVALAAGQVIDYPSCIHGLDGDVKLTSEGLY